jgi:uncharacterized protein YkwD
VLVAIAPIHGRISAMAAHPAPAVGVAVAAALISAVGVFAIVSGNGLDGQGGSAVEAHAPIAVRSSASAVAPVRGSTPRPTAVARVIAASGRPGASSTAGGNGSAAAAQAGTTVTLAPPAPSGPSGGASGANEAGGSAVGASAQAGGSLAGNSANSVRRLRLSTRPANPARALLAAINAARKEQGLPALTWSDGLARAAHQHSVAMAQADTLSHQVGDEAPPLDRVLAEAVPAHWVGENVGRTATAGTAGALDLDARMLAEQAPSDWHRQNLLSPSARSIGIDALCGPDGSWWLTEDLADAQ